MEGKKQGKNKSATIEQEKTIKIERKAVIRAETEKARTRKSEANAGRLLTTRLAMEAKLRAVAAMALEQEKALEIERAAGIRAETEKAKI
jgi:hypothetical protein